VKSVGAGVRDGVGATVDGVEVGADERGVIVPTVEVSGRGGGWAETHIWKIGHFGSGIGWENLAELLVGEVEPMTLFRQRLLLLLGRPHGTSSDLVTQHEAQESGEDGGHRPSRVPRARVI